MQISVHLNQYPFVNHHRMIMTISRIIRVRIAFLKLTNGSNYIN